jgi:hypothetical protein
MGGLNRAWMNRAARRRKRPTDAKPEIWFGTIGPDDFVRTTIVPFGTEGPLIYVSGLLTGRQSRSEVKKTHTQRRRVGHPRADQLRLG